MPESRPTRMCGICQAADSSSELALQHDSWNASTALPRTHNMIQIQHVISVCNRGTRPEHFLEHSQLRSTSASPRKLEKYANGKERKEHWNLGSGSRNIKLADKVVSRHSVQGRLQAGMGTLDVCRSIMGAYNKDSWKTIHNSSPVSCLAPSCYQEDKSCCRLQTCPQVSVK